jgi:hypothetical protein
LNNQYNNITPNSVFSKNNSTTPSISTHLTQDSFNTPNIPINSLNIESGAKSNKRKNTESIDIQPRASKKTTDISNISSNIKCATCGQVGHAKRNSKKCPDNPKNKKAIPIETIQAHELDATEEIIFSIIDDLNDENQTCVCGSSDHANPNSLLCSRNPINISNTNNDKNLRRCRCGSDMHLRITHRSCPLNIKNTKNSTANVINCVEDINLINENSVEVTSQYSLN